MEVATHAASVRLNVGSKPGLVSTSTRRHNRIADTTVTLRQSLNKSRPESRVDTYTKPRRNVLLIDILCDTDLWMFLMKYIGISRTTRSKAMVNASLERKKTL